ncbi:HAD-IIB family hydrolase [bacterium]|nr:HAD-IIB family hydrolase [bacterium]
MDGTLIKRHSYEVSKLNVEAINQFTELNNYFVIATGRFIYRVFPLLDKINEQKENVNFIISLVGSYIYDVSKKQTIYMKTIEEELFSNLKEIIIKNKIVALVYSQESFSLKKAFGFNLKNKKFFLKLTGNMNAQFANENTIITKPLKIIIPFVLQKKGKYLKNLFDKYQDQVKIILQRNYIEIVQKDVNKGQAISFLLKYLNINEQDYTTVGIGDSENDLDMFNKTKRNFIVNKDPEKSRLNKFNYPIINNSDFNAVSKILYSLIHEQSK